MGDDIGSGSVTDCHLRSDSDPLSSTNLPYGENQNKPFYQFRCNHPLITQLIYHYFFKVAFSEDVIVLVRSAKFGSKSQFGNF